MLVLAFFCLGVLIEKIKVICAKCTKVILRMK
jgi:hypothetical protein